MKTKFSIIFLFFVLNVLLSAQDIRVLSSTASSIVVEYRPIYQDTSYIKTEKGNYIKLNVSGTFIENLFKVDKRPVPVREINVGVPSEFGNTIQIISSEYSTMQGSYIPNPTPEKDSIAFHLNYITLQSENFETQNELVTFGEFGLIRNLPVQTIKIYPIEIDESNRTIKTIKKIVFSVSFGKANISSERISEEFLERTVINWETAKNWGISSKINLMKTSSSFLADGQWYRMEIPEEGIYKIDRNFLQSMGIDVSTINPKTIKIYTGGGYVLPENYNSPRPAGFEEIPLLVSGEQDGKFDSGDYVLFYGRGTEFWEYNSSMKKIIRVKHPYSKKNYCWLTFGGNDGKRIAEKISLNIQGAYNQPNTLSYRSNDNDLINIGQTGRDYFGDEFSFNTNSRTYITTLNGIVPSSKINYRFRIANDSEPTITFRLYESNSQIYSTPIAGDEDYLIARENIGTASYSQTLSDERSNLKFSIESGSASLKVYLDYFEIEYRRFLRAVNDNLLFFSKDTSSVIEYTITNFTTSSIQVYDVTNYADVKIINSASISGGQIKFQSNEIQNNVKRYLAVSSNGYKTPSNGTQISNSNIRGNVSGTELILITSKAFRSQAERYANYRSNQSPYKISTSIYYVDDIFNEFSNGMMDPTAIRDFLKFAYDNWQVKPFYVLLLGDGDYDYLNTVKEDIDKNIVPTYQTIESLYKIYSYPLDDYYTRISGNDKKVDLAIGRLCVQTPTEADNVIDKIINYENNLEKGLWKTTITLVADDGPQAVGIDDGSTHTRQSENLANNKIPRYFDQNKIYLAAYPTVISGLGRRKPGVNKAIVDAINNETLLLNYIGHGNPNTWAHEYVFEKASTIPQIKNENYFFLTAATCDFGKYDDISEQSSAEIMVNMVNTGAIGAFTAARVVFSTANAEINDSFYTNLFSKKDEQNLPVRIGRAYFLTKQYRTEDNDEKYHLFCDPTLRLDEPILSALIDSVNNKSLQAAVQINALGDVKIKATVKNLNGLQSNYNGEAIFSVYDSERQLELKEMNYTITLQGGLIHRSRTSVTDGEFQTEFIVSKDISYENKNGKIIAYFSNDSGDGVGFSKNIIVGGSNPNAVNDGKGPEIEIFFDDESFANSYLVNQDFTLIAKLSDQTGLNTTGTGIGHKLEGIINDDENNSVDFTNFFIGDLNSGGKSGVVRYKFTSMKPGDYKIKIKAWDVFNNLATQEGFFTVVSPDAGLTVRDIYNYPNPFSSSTTFTFQHNIGSSINVKIKVYTVAGRLIKEIEERDVLDKFVRIEWDGRDEDGNMLSNGTYLYKLIVESSDGKYKDNALGKLAVIR